MRRGYADTALGQVHYAEAGAGEPLILLGSSSRSSRMFLNLMEQLAGDFRVIAIDRPGTGNSDPLPPGLTMRDLAANVVAVMDALALDRAHIYGFHTGNKIGSALAAEWPQRVSRLIMAGQTHSILPDAEDRNKAIGDRAKTYSGQLDEERGLVISWATLSQRVSSLWWQTKYFDAGDPAAAVREAQRVILDELESFEAIRELYRLNFGYDIEQDWARITCPTLVLEIVTSREDYLYQRQGAEVQGKIPGAELAVFEAQGYKVTLEDRAADLAKVIAAYCSGAPRS
ncbi:MAG TPA: alpha/beta hydrolase [Streptosporangiaceae bacterium]|jgi:pimeloyl-ACP methyl ester carboxylesterase|nr:alpha/beta hydrolase [Streptosporangiaceae bacterium]